MGAVFLDADSDGDLDLYVASGSAEFAPGDERLRDRLYLNDGFGVFKEAHDVPSRSSGQQFLVAAADFDRDGDVDLFMGTRSLIGQYQLPADSRILRNDGGVFHEVTSEVAPDLLKAGHHRGRLDRCG